MRAPAQGLTLPYAELEERANQLAHRLIALGVGPEVPVGVMMLRSLDLVVALLGVLKAGGAYVPMDPDYPPDRLALMMEDSGVRSPSHIPCRMLFFKSEGTACVMLPRLRSAPEGCAWVCRRRYCSARAMYSHGCTCPQQRAFCWCGPLHLPGG